MRHPLSTESLVAWLEKQPAEGRYDFRNPYNCLLCQYFRDMGLPVVSVIPDGWREKWEAGHRLHPLPEGWNKVAEGKPWDESTRGFGSALERARELLAKEVAA